MGDCGSPGAGGVAPPVRGLAAVSLILAALRAVPAPAQAMDSGGVRADIPLCRRVRLGMLARVNAGSRSRVVGPVLRCDEQTLALGPYLDSTQTLVPIAAVRHVWVRARAGGAGFLLGAGLGGGLGVLFTAVRSRVCSTPSTTAVNCGGNVLVGAGAGLAIGGLVGWVLGRGFPRWQRIYP